MGKRTYKMVIMHNNQTKKILVLALMIFSVVVGYSQNVHISLTKKGDRLSATLDDNNLDKSFVIRKSNISDSNYFNVTVSDEVINADWKRIFFIHNSADSDVATLQTMSDGFYRISLKELSEKLQAGKEYYLYTIAQPTDPKKAMLVKVARILICKIVIED